MCLAIYERHVMRDTPRWLKSTPINSHHPGKGIYMKRRSLLKFGSMSGALALAGQVPFAQAQSGSGPIKVGILHSLSGTMAISETSLKDTALMTIADINKNGGVMGRKIEPVVVDPASNWPVFAEKARQLLTQDKC